MSNDVEKQMRMFPHRLKDALRRKRVFKDGVYQWTTWPSTDDAIKYINSTDIVAAVVFTDEQRELLLKYRDKIDVAKIMSAALTKELKSIDAHHRSAAWEQRRLEQNPEHVLKPEVGDRWRPNRFGAYDGHEFVVMQVFGEDDIVVWGNFLMAGKDSDTGYMRVNRQWIVGHVHFDCGQECRLTDLDPRMWGMDCHPISKESEDYKSLIAHNETYDYSKVASILGG